VRPAEIEQPSITYKQKNEDAPDEVMDVEPADRDPVEWAVVVDDEADDEPDAEKGDEEGYRGDEHAAARPVGNGGADEEAQTRQLQQDQQHHDDCAGENQQQQGSSSGHTLLKHFGTRIQRWNWRSPTSTT